MPYVLGIDIGTTSTVAATARPDGDPAPQLLALGTRGAAVPSVLFLDAAGHVLVGEAAERRTVSDPERVVREVKRRVGDTVPVSVGDVSVAPEDLFAAQARWVVDRAEEREGEPPVAVAVAVPATWGSYRAGIVRDALADAGLTDVTLVSEPRAAARHYLAQPRVADGATVAVYDFGGGTFDAAVLRRSGPEGCEIVGRPEGLERLGGADLDELVLANVAGAVGDGLTDLSPEEPGVLAALARLRRECTEAKEALSADAETTVPVLLPGLQTQVRIVRAELEELIAPAVEETVATLAAALDAAHVSPEELEAILLVGGSSRIPLVAELLSARFGRPLAVDTDPQASVALGAARAAAESLAVTTADVAAPALSRGWTVAAGSISGLTAVDDELAGPSAPTPDEAPARLAAAGSSFVPRLVPARRRHVTGVRVLAVSAAVLGITVVTSVAGQTPAVLEAGRSTLSSVVHKLGDSVQPDTPAAAAAEAKDGAAGAGAPMATDASVFAGRRAQGHATATTSPQQTGPARPGGPTSSDPRSPAAGATTGRGTTAPRPAGATGGGAGPGTPAPSSPSPTAPGTGTPGTGTPGTGTPGTGTPTPTPVPTTPPATQQPTPSPTTPPATPDPTEPPTSNPTTPPTTQEPTEPPTSNPTTPPTTQEPTTPAATPTTAPTETAGPTTDPAPPSPSAGGG